MHFAFNVLLSLTFLSSKQSASLVHHALVK